MECERALSPGRGKIDAVGNARTACTLGRGAAPPAAQPAGRAQKARRGMGEAAGRPAERPGPREPPPVCREHSSQFPKSSHCVWKGSVLQSTPGTEAQGRRSRNSPGRCEKVHASSAWGLVSERPQHATGQPSPLPFLPHDAGPRGACFRVSRAAGAPAISWTLHRAGRGSEEKARGPQPACSGGLEGQRVTHRVVMGPSSPRRRCRPQMMLMEVPVDVCTPVFTAVPFTAAGRWE